MMIVVMTLLLLVAPREVISFVSSPTTTTTRTTKMMKPAVVDVNVGTATATATAAAAAAAAATCRICTITSSALSMMRGSSSSNNNNNNNNNGKRDNKFDPMSYYRKRKEAATQDRLVNALFAPPDDENDDNNNSDGKLMLIHLVGQGKLKVSSKKNIEKQAPISLLFLSNEAVTKQQQRRRTAFQQQQQQQETNSKKAVVSTVLAPLGSSNQLKLVSFAVAKRPLSKSVLLSLNMHLVNRDGALFDNLPWSAWSIDPQRRNRDAANNPIVDKFHLGKRDAYYRFMGKDWQGRSLGLGNLALRLKYMLDEMDGALPAGARRGEEEAEAEQEEEQDSSNESGTTLAIRILQLQIREVQMELAGIESRLAVAAAAASTTTATNNDNHDQNKDDVDEEEDNSDSLLSAQQLEETKLKLQRNIETMEGEIESLETKKTAAKSSLLTILRGILQRVADWSTNDGQNAAPYRGAMGYAPMLDTMDDIDGSLLPYTSPFDLMKEILDDQLNAKVIGCVLENTSLLRGNTVLGGAVVLQRIIPKKKRSLLGEEVEYQDYDEDFGNINAKGGETMIVECDSDEAIGLSIAYDLPLRIGSALFEASSVRSIRQTPQSDDGLSSEQQLQQHILETLPTWIPFDSEIMLQIEGERQTTSPDKLSPISMPGNFEDNMMPSGESSSTTSTMFPVDSPIKSLDEYDGLTNEDKARTLLEISNFNGKLPRPRVVRQSISSSKSGTNPLDELLLPLIDEAVRRQYLIRDAERRGDVQRAAELRVSKSRRLTALEKAQAARNNGDGDLADSLDSESAFLETLRADITQDEGAYSRFLDRDDWYERDRQKTAKRVKKSSFGTLLDGIE